MPLRMLSLLRELDFNQCVGARRIMQMSPNKGANQGVELTAKEKLRLDELLAALKLFSDLEPNMPVNMMRVLVYAARYEGTGSLEIGKKLGMESGPASRFLGDWGKFDRYHKPSHGYIEGRSIDEDRRAKKQYLTFDGQGFLLKLLRALGVR